MATVMAAVCTSKEGLKTYFPPRAPVSHVVTSG